VPSPRLSFFWSLTVPPLCEAVGQFRSHLLLPLIEVIKTGWASMSENSTPLVPPWSAPARVFTCPLPRRDFLFSLESPLSLIRDPFHSETFPSLFCALEHRYSDSNSAFFPPFPVEKSFLFRLFSRCFPPSAREPLRLFFQCSSTRPAALPVPLLRPLSKEPFIYFRDNVFRLRVGQISALCAPFSPSHVAFCID